MKNQKTLPTPNPQEKRGPIEKGEKGWPINPFGALILFVFVLIVIFLIARPLFQKKLTHSSFVTGQLVSPKSGEIVRGEVLPIKLTIDNPSKVARVEFWVKIYAQNRWEKIGEVSSNPYELGWQIPDTFKNKAIAITAHIYQKDGNIIKDPGGWREGIIILSP